MEPSQTPVNQPNQAAPAPVPLPVPTPPPAPQPVPPAPATPYTTMAQPQPFTAGTPAPVAVGTPNVAPAPSSKSSLPLVIGIVAAVLFGLVAIIIGYTLLFSPSAQSKRLSGNFMHSITTGDVAKAVTLAGDNSAKNFLTSASSKVKGTYKLSDSTYQNGTGYYLYALSGAAENYARTTIEKQDGKRVVSSFVYSNNPLKLIPSRDATEGAAKETPTPAPAVAESTAANCLVRKDYSFFSNLGIDFTQPHEFAPFAQIKFNPDAANYAAGSTPEPSTVFADFKAFYAANPNKKYAVELEASVNSATPDVPLATARNNKISADLLSISGIPASKIRIQPITNDTSGGGAGDSFNRQVQLLIAPDYSCPTI